MSNTKNTYGGQAVIEGVMIRGQNNVTTSVRNPQGKIQTRVKPIGEIFTGKPRRFPLIRGILALAETLYLGMDSLSYSASVSDGESDEEISKLSIASMIGFSVLIAIALFFLLPLIASKPFEGLFGSDIISNVVEGVLRLVIFVMYIFGIGLMSDIRRVYMYHGAEHMTVHAMEKGDPLVVAEIRKYPTAHPRCGTAFLLTVMIIAIIVFTLVPRDPFWMVIISRIVLIPVIASLSYEVIRLSGKYSQNFMVSLIMAPSLWLQKLTTRQPDDAQIEVAISAMTAAVEADKDLT
tara:strand:+ start:786 stop:1664 length:879 start_codon:yes stop_codon:yes gene_type:complete